MVRFCRRFRRPAPLLFLALLLMSLIAGLLYAPYNGDSNAYRTPRVLHWLWHEHWHWIRTFDSRMNISSSGFEWLSAPLVLLTRTDRFFFLINWCCYAMFPGLVFSMLLRFKVRPRVAWWWMWLLPGAWCFALQASSIINDLPGVIFALAAVVLAFRARESGSIGDLWLSALAAALMTAVKPTNLPLGLLWLVPAFPALKLLLRRPAVSACVAATALLISFVPNAAMNLQHGREWTGLEKDTRWELEPPSPFWGVVGGVFTLTTRNLMPPFFPWADNWNRAMERFVETPVGAPFKSVHRFGVLSEGMHSVGESNAGIGLGICGLVAVSIAGAWCYRKRGSKRPLSGRLARWMQGLPWILALVFMAKVATVENARQMAPYYSFLLPLILARRGHERLVRRRWWQVLAILTLLATAGLVVISRGRPLLPMRTILARLEAARPDSRFIARVRFAYDTRVATEKHRTFFSSRLPAGEKVVGFAGTLALSSVGVWLPFGERQVVHVLPNDSPETVRSMGFRYLVLEEPFLIEADETLEQWTRRYGAEVVATYPYHNRSWEPPIGLHLLRLIDSPAQEQAGSFPPER